MEEKTNPKLIRPKVNKILYATAVFIFFNIVLSAYLVYEFYVLSENSVCSINALFDCITVAQSDYAILFGIPVSIWGLLFYIGLFVGVLGVALKVPFYKIYKKLRPNTVLNICRFFAYFGLLFSLYLTYVEAFVIYVYCPFCLAQQAFIIVIVALLVWVNKVINKGKKGNKSMRVLLTPIEMKKYISLLIIVALVSLAGCSKPIESDLADEQLVSIAQCLTEKGVKMYGAIWCSHCKNQKEAFGDAFQYIDYIECDPQTDLEGAKECIEAGIEGVPAWHFPDGTKKTGEIAPSELAETAGCSENV